MLVLSDAYTRFQSQTHQYGLTGSGTELLSLTKTDDKDCLREDWLTIVYIKNALPVQDNSSSPLSSLSQSNSFNQEQSQLNTSNMKTTTILTTLAVVLGASIDSVAATCFGSGDVFQDKGNARWHVGRACRGYDGNQGAFQGTFAPGEAKYACVQGTNTQKYEITVQNLNTGAAFDLGDGDCVLRLENEINGCDRGGESTVSGWRFRYVFLQIRGAGRLVCSWLTLLRLFVVSILTTVSARVMYRQQCSR